MPIGWCARLAHGGLTALLALVAVLSLPTGAAALPAAVEEHLVDVVQWAYRGSEVHSSLSPTCETVCQQLWTAETELDAGSPRVQELWREARELRIQAHLDTRFSGSGEIETDGSGKTVTWQIGGGSRWLHETISIPRISVPRGQTLWLRPVNKGQRVAGGSGSMSETWEFSAPTMGWVAYTSPSRETDRGMWFTGWDECSELTQTTTMPVLPNTEVRTFPDPISCQIWIAENEFVHSLKVNVHWLFTPATIAPPTDVARYDAGLTYRSEFPSSQRAATEAIEDQLRNHPNDYALLVRWLDHRLRGVEADPFDERALLERYEPISLFEEGEPFLSQTVEAFTDHWEAFEGRWVESNEYDNLLWDGVGSEPEDIIAAAGSPGPPFAPPLLTLGLLEEPGSGAEYLDARGSATETYAADALAMRGLGYGETIYARLVQDPDDGKFWLQYWSFYYDNPFNVGPSEIGEHEGDWEMVQVGLGQTGEPDAMTFATHNGGIGCPWSLIEHEEAAPEAPLVYVGLGSHASYPHEGATELAPVVDDNHHGDGVSARPSITVIDETTRWINWDGRWGSSTEGSFQSPISPSQQGDKWSYPSTFHREHVDPECE